MFVSKKRVIRNGYLIAFEGEEMSDEEALERGLVKDDKAKRGQRCKKNTDAEPDVEPDAETDEAES